jgi:PBP1b-binding outer membrane lipoprotein LpoB
MRRALIIAITLLLAACGSSEDSKVTETRMDDIDSLEGTISDEMVETDELNEQPMIDTSAPAGSSSAAKPKVKGDDKPEKGAAQTKAAATPQLKVEPGVNDGE